MSRICLISPHHVSFQPRILREADTLSEAGHDVRVVSRRIDPTLDERDQRLMQTRKWRLQTVNLLRAGSQRHRWFLESVRLRGMQKLVKAGVKNSGVVTGSYMIGLSQLSSVAASEPADWFIAHTQGALPAASAAASRWKAKLGFDCEDLLAYTGTDPPKVVRAIEKRYLPRCDYISTPSQLIADHLVQEYDVAAPKVLYNVFPLSLVSGMLPPRERPVKPTLRLHWFSQTIGPDRGIEEAIKAVSLVGENVELHLRGQINPEYSSVLDGLAQSFGVGSHLVIHSPVDHDELFRTMTQFDVGLALENPKHENYSLTVTNKIFTYMLSGLAVAATDTPGQREAMNQAPGAGFLYQAGDAQELATALKRWLFNSDELRVAQQAAWDAARAKFCWDVEQKKLFAAMQLANVADGNISDTKS